MNKSLKKSSPAVKATESKPWYRRTKVIISLISGIVAVSVPVITIILPAMIAKGPLTEAHTFVGKVSDATTTKGIRGAKVSLVFPGKIPPVAITDSEGAFSFPISPGLHEIRVLVEAEGYNLFDRRIDISTKSEPEDIRLIPINVPPLPISTASEVNNQNRGKSNEKPPTKMPPISKSRKDPSDLEERKQAARKALNYNGSGPMP